MAQLNNLIVTGSSRFLNKINGTCTDGTAGTTKYMRQDGTWEVPPNDNTTYTLDTNGNNVRLKNGAGTVISTITAPYATSAGSAAPTSHTHGNITNGGEITSDTAIANGSQLVITATSTNPKVARSPITFDNSTTNQCLTKKGTWATFTANTGTVTQVKVGSTPYDPSSGVVSLPAYPTTLPASDTVHTYSSTSEAPISGKGVADALANLPSPTGGTVTSVTIKGTSPIVSSSETAITTSGTRTISHANSGVTAGTYRSVTVNATGHVTAGTNPTTLSGYGITDAKIASGTITLGSNTITPLTSSSTLDATKLSGTIPTSCYTDTKNTAGSTDTSSKIFLIGATSQAANPQTYSQNTAYVGTDGCLYSGGTKVLTSHQDISGKLNKSGGEITGTVYSQTNGANFEVYSPSWTTVGTPAHKMRFTATDTPRSGLYDMIASKWAFWKNADGEYQIGPNGYAVQARTQAKGTTKYPLRDGVVFAFRSGASNNTITVACVSQWSGDSVIYQHHVSSINVAVDTWHETIKVTNNHSANIQVIMIGQFNDNSTY